MRSMVRARQRVGQSEQDRGTCCPSAMKFRKRPVIIEALQFTKETKDQVFNFVRCNAVAEHDTTTGNPILIIQTSEGDMTAKLGDWVIKGVKDEFYPCKPDIFELTYEKVE